RRRRDHWQGFQVLRVAPVIQYPHLLHARNGATRRTKLFGGVLSAPHLRRVLRQGNPWIPALLRAPMDQPVLANIQISRPSAASPVVFLPTRHVVLKFVESGE